MKENCTYFKSELFKMPKQREAEFKAKYQSYQDKIKEFEH